MIIENLIKIPRGNQWSNVYEYIPHFIGFGVLSYQQKPPQYIIKDKQDETSLMSFYVNIKNNLCQGETPETREDQIESL